MVAKTGVRGIGGVAGVGGIGGVGRIGGIGGLLYDRSPVETQFIASQKVMRSRRPTINLKSVVIVAAMSWRLYSKMNDRVVETRFIASQKVIRSRRLTINLKSVVSVGAIYRAFF